jgi:glycosyltransferase involved in cell wall biosynthesis
MTEKEKIKIAMVAPADNPHTKRFADAFLSLGYELKVVSYENGVIDGAEVYVHSNVPEDVKGIRRKWEYFKDYAKVRNILEWADVVFVNFIYNWRFNEVYRGLNNIIVLLWGSDITCRTDETAEQVKYKKLILSLASKILAFSQFLASEAEIYLPENKEIEVLRVGVDIDHYYPVKKTWAEDDPIIIGYAKGLNAKYGAEYLIKACDYLKQDGFNFRCRIAGGGDLEVPLKVLVNRLGLDDYVEFVGKLPYYAVADFMREIDIFVMPSVVQESYGVAVLEASATGIPVVASDVGGVSEVLWDDETGILVQSENPVELAIALKLLIANPDIRGCMGRQGRDFVKRNFPWNNTIKRLDEIFREVIAGPRKG